VRRINAFEAGFIAFGAALNVSIGYLVNVLKLPLYLDSTGTIFVSVLCGWWYGIMVGLTSLVVMTFTASPTALAYTGTAIVIAGISAAAGRFGFLRNMKSTLFWGFVVGLSASMTSFPVTAFVFGGVSLAGSDALTAFLKASGMPVWKSVFLGGLITDTVDKLVTSCICFSLIRSMPSRMIERFSFHRHVS
jgi:energy-coupling factor transport system substrate-specific component